MQIDRFCEGLLSFLQASPTPFHAVQTMVMTLEQAGFEHLDEGQDWQRLKRGNYYTTRNDASLIAFRMGPSDTEGRRSAYDEQRLGFNMVGAHTDSPCLKLKPNPDIEQSNYWQLNTEVYGSPLLHTWFDRDLSLAGRIHYVDQSNELCRSLIDFEKPVCSIPSLAIHLNRTVNESSSINAQKHLLPLLKTRAPIDQASLKKSILQRLNQGLAVGAQELLDFDLYLYDTQPPQLCGLDEEFITSARLDNLLSCYIGLMSLVNSDSNQRSLLVCNDHEEVGSQSASGAQGPFLRDTLKRLFNNHERYAQCIAQSFLISADNAHAQHPNYADKHDDNHAPKINAGPVIKTNANQRYATTSETSAIVQYLAQVVEVPLQSFASRSDLACGSTIGPLTSAELGVRTLDIGVPQFAMHSIREIAGKQDAFNLFKLLNAFFSLPAVPSANPILPPRQTHQHAKPSTQPATSPRKTPQRAHRQETKQATESSKQHAYESKTAPSTRYDQRTDAQSDRSAKAQDSALGHGSLDHGSLEHASSEHGDSEQSPLIEEKTTDQNGTQNQQHSPQASDATPTVDTDNAPITTPLTDEKQPETHNQEPDVQSSDGQIPSGEHNPAQTHSSVSKVGFEAKDPVIAPEEPQDHTPPVPDETPTVEENASQKNRGSAHRSKRPNKRDGRRHNRATGQPSAPAQRQPHVEAASTDTPSDSTIEWSTHSDNANTNNNAKPDNGVSTKETTQNKEPDNQVDTTNQT